MVVQVRWSGRGGSVLSQTEGTADRCECGTEAGASAASAANLFAGNCLFLKSERQKSTGRSLDNGRACAVKAQPCPSNAKLRICKMEPG